MDPKTNSQFRAALLKILSSRKDVGELVSRVLGTENGNRNAITLLACLMIVDSEVEAGLSKFVTKEESEQCTRDILGFLNDLAEAIKQQSESCLSAMH